MKLLVLAGALSLLAICEVQAEPLLVNLAPDADSGGSIGTLDVGENIITGSLNIGDSQIPGFSFSVDLPVGLVISSGALEITDDENGDAAFTEPLNGDHGYGNGTFTLDAPYSTPGPLDVAYGNVQESCVGGNPPVCTYSTYDFSLQYTVTSDATAPEPASFPLLGIGLAALMALSRKNNPGRSGSARKSAA
jgi:hypothetical protein